MAKGKGPSGPSRSAITGRYVTPAYAASHPRTTVTESRKPAPKKTPPKGKK